MKAIRLLFLTAGLLAAQQLKLDLGRLASRASNSVDISLSGPTLQLAARFLDADDPEEAQVKKLIVGLQGIYIRVFTFKEDGAWSEADLDSVRLQLKTPDWSRIVGYRSTAKGESADVFVRMENQKVGGVAILYTGAREVTVVNIAGPVDLDTLAELSGHFGVPSLMGPASRKND